MTGRRRSLTDGRLDRLPEREVVKLLVDHIIEGNLRCITAVVVDVRR
jgi:hypothetical protein